MKTNVIFLFCLMFTLIAFGQNETKETEPLFTGERNATELHSNSSAINRYVKDNIRYPKEAAECCIEGTEVVEFVVTPEGNVTDFKIINSVCTPMDEEVIRVLEGTNGMWKPGEEGGNPVAKKEEVAVVFSMCNMETGPALEDFTIKARKWCSRGDQSLLYEKKLRKALRAYNSGIRLKPYDQALLAVRGLCKFEMGDKEGAQKDWKRLRDLGGVDMTQSLVENTKELKGYKELVTMLQSEKKSEM